MDRYFVHFAFRLPSAASGMNAGSGEARAVGGPENG
jgi:hypothetical protein